MTLEYFLNLRLTILLLKTVKLGRFVHSELVVASHISMIYLTMILKMNRMDSVEGQASHSDERYLFLTLVPNMILVLNKIAGFFAEKALKGSQYNKICVVRPVCLHMSQVANSFVFLDI